MSEKLERRIELLPAWDKRSADPKKNFGIHSVEMCWYVKGQRGVIQFVIYTSWMLPEVARELEEKGRYLSRPLAADLGYHSYVPLYEGQEPQADKCPLLDNLLCFYDGSGVAASETFDILLRKGGEAVWTFLENHYRWVFENVNQSALPSKGEFISNVRRPLKIRE